MCFLKGLCSSCRHPAGGSGLFPDERRVRGSVAVNIRLHGYRAYEYGCFDSHNAGVSAGICPHGDSYWQGGHGDWFVGNISAGGSANLIVQASVDSGTGGTTITNTVTVDFLSQIDPNASNDIASVDIDPIGVPGLLILKAVVTVEDPFNGTSNPKAIPGATIRYMVLTTNTGTGPVDTDTLVVTDAIPTNVALRVTDFDGATIGSMSTDAISFDAFGAIGLSAISAPAEARI